MVHCYFESVVHSYWYLILLQKKYDLSDLTIHSLEDSEGILNAFEIRGKLNSWNVLLSLLSWCWRNSFSLNLNRYCKSSIINPHLSRKPPLFLSFRNQNNKWHCISSAHFWDISLEHKFTYRTWVLMNMSFEYSLKFLGLLFHARESSKAGNTLVRHFLDLHRSTIYVISEDFFGLHQTDYSSPVLILQLTEMLWNYQPTMPMRKQHGLTQSSSLVKVQRFANTRKRVVWHHHHLGWRDILHHYQNERIQSQVLLEVNLLARRQTQLHLRGLLVLLVCIHR